MVTPNEVGKMEGLASWGGPTPEHLFRFALGRTHHTIHLKPTSEAHLVSSGRRGSPGELSRGGEASELGGMEADGGAEEESVTHRMPKARAVAAPLSTRRDLAQ